ncbi:MAG: aminotransferase class III-fold pyridoxal phosphate-dependent enzyme [Nitrospinota bacterium]
MEKLLEAKRIERDAATIRVSPPLPGPLAARWVEFYMKNSPPSTYVYPFVWDVSQPAQGPFCTDPDGNVFMDFYGHVASAPLGYNHPEILRRTGVPFDPIKTADHDTYLAAGPDPQVPCPLPSASEGASHFMVPAHLQARLLEISAPFEFGKVFLVNSGAEAASNAIKVACHRKYQEVRRRLGDKLWRELCRQLGVRLDGFIEGLYEDYPLFGIAFEGAFHGRTLGVLSLSKSKRQHKEGFPSIRWVRHLPYGQLPLPLGGAN